MSVGTTKTAETFTGIAAGVDCVVADMKVYGEDQIVVFVAATSEEAVKNIDYTLSIAGDKNGCTVTPLAPLAARTSTIRVVRRTPLLSDFAIAPLGRVDEVRLTEQLDRNVMRLQEDVGKVDRSLRVSDAETAITALPGAVARSNTLLGFDENGNVVLRSATGGAVTSVNGQAGVVVLTKTDIGLSNADNTSDATKFNALPAKNSSFADVAPAASVRRFRDRSLFGDAVAFSGKYNVDAADFAAFPLPMLSHSWAFRDADVLSDSAFGGMALVGHSQKSKNAAWPGYPSAASASIGVGGFGINDVGNSGAWGGYFEVKNFANAFSVGVEAAAMHVGNTLVANPFNVKTGGANGGVAAWLQAGGGVDAVMPDKTMRGFRAVPAVHGGGTLKINGSDVVMAANATATAIVIAINSAAIAGVTASQTAGFVSIVHTTTRPSLKGTLNEALAVIGLPGNISAGLVLLSSYADNQTGAYTGVVIADGACADRSGGSNVFEAMSMPSRHQIAWYRADQTLAGYVWCDPGAAGSNGLTIKDGFALFDGGLSVGDDTFKRALVAGKPTDTYDAGDYFEYDRAGNNANWYFGNVLRHSMNQFAVNTTGVYAVGGTQVLGARKTGWAAATGTATRTTFATSTVTLPQLAEHFKALLDDLISHGTIGA